MPNCAFPRCSQEAGVDVIPARKEYCKAHERALCFYNNVKNPDGTPKCEEMTVPHSGWCGVHNEVVALFDFIHTMRHEEALKRQLAQKVTKDILKGVQLNGGGLLYKGR